MKYLLILLTVIILQGCASLPESSCKTNNEDYPQEAVAKCIEGYVRLKFDIGVDGKPVNIIALESYPKGVFEEAGISALSKWLYKPTIKNGKPVLTKDLTIQLDFVL